MPLTLLKLIGLLTVKMPMESNQKTLKIVMKLLLTKQFVQNWLISLLIKITVLCCMV